jgi:Sortase domain
VRSSRLVAGLAVATGLVAVAWLIASGDDSNGAEPRSPSTTSAAQRSPSTSPSTTGSPGRAGVAHPAPSQIDAGRPVALTLPSGTTMAIDASATGTDGALQIPVDVERAGWWDGSSRLGDPFGSVVVAAHVDSFTQGLGRFVELLGMQPGDVITVRSRHLEQRFVVTTAHLVPRADVTATSGLYAARGKPRLVLITCGGDYSPDSGYADNMVVVARPIAPPASR